MVLWCVPTGSEIIQPIDAQENLDSCGQIKTQSLRAALLAFICIKKKKNPLVLTPLGEIPHLKSSAAEPAFLLHQNNPPCRVHQLWQKEKTFTQFSLMRDSRLSFHWCRNRRATCTSSILCNLQPWFARLTGTLISRVLSRNSLLNSLGKLFLVCSSSSV